MKRVIVIIAILMMIEIGCKYVGQAKWRMRKDNDEKKNKRTKKQEQLGTPFRFPETFKEIAELMGSPLRAFDMDRMEFELIYKNRQLTKGEIKNIWQTIDTSHNDKIDEKEWKFFHKLFVKPFEDCDGDEDYILNKDELGACLEGDQLKNMGLTAENATQIMEAIDRDEENSGANFADYIFLRRVKLGWEQCAGGTELSKIQIPCAMKIAVPGWIMSINDAYQLFDAVQAIEVGVAKFYDTYMTLGQYIEYAHIYYYFISFGIPYQNGMLKKKDVVRAIDYQEVPSTLNDYLIDMLFGENETIQLKTFGCSLILYRTFKRHSKQDKFYMAEDEFMKVYDDPHLNRAMVRMIDSFVFNTREEIDNAAEVSRQNYSMNEQDFLVSFIQNGEKYKYHNRFSYRHETAMRHRLKSKYKSQYRHHLRIKARYQHYLTKLEVEPNEENRKAVYNIFEFKGKEMLSFKHFMRFWKTSWFFLNCDEDLNRILHWDELRTCIRKYTPPIEFTVQEQSNLQYAQDFIGTPKIHSLNLKQFYDMFQYRDVFEYYKAPNFISYVSKANMEKSFYFLGLKVTEDTLDDSKQGVDPVTKVPLYNYWSAFQNAMKEEIVALKLTKEEQIQEFMDEHASKRLKSKESKETKE